MIHYLVFNVRRSLQRRGSRLLFAQGRSGWSSAPVHQNRQ